MRSSPIQYHGSTVDFRHVCVTLLDIVPYTSWKNPNLRRSRYATAVLDRDLETRDKFSFNVAHLVAWNSITLPKALADRKISAMNTSPRASIAQVAH